MKTKLRLLAVALIAGGTMFAQSRFSIGVSVGGYGPGAYPPPTYAQYQPPCPGPGYSWVDGYWTPQGGRNVWSAGYWRRPVVTGCLCHWMSLSLDVSVIECLCHWMSLSIERSAAFSGGNRPPIGRHQNRPPSTRKCWAVQAAPSSAARNSTIWANSSGRIRRLII